MTWNDLYESTPRQGYNPGYGAREFQTMKARVSERVSVEHIFGQNETDSGYSLGLHKEGSGRILVVDEGSASRDSLYRLEVMSDVGRLKASVDERASSLQIDDTDPIAPDYESDNYAKLQISSDILGDDSVAVVTLFDYDKMVNLTFDQSIGGLKEFSLKARVQDLDSALASKTDNNTAIVWTDVDDKRNVMPAEQLVDLISDAKEHNIFDSTDSYNDNTTTVDGIVYTNEDIYAQTIRAQYVYGAVWG